MCFGGKLGRGTEPGSQQPPVSSNVTKIAAENGGDRHVQGLAGAGVAAGVSAGVGWKLAGQAPGESNDRYF